MLAYAVNVVFTNGAVETAEYATLAAAEAYLAALQPEWLIAAEIVDPDDKVVVEL